MWRSAHGQIDDPKPPSKLTQPLCLADTRHLQDEPAAFIPANRSDEHGGKGNEEKKSAIGGPLFKEEGYLEKNSAIFLMAFFLISLS